MTSQHFANFYLSPCDRFIKEDRQTPGYVRYMDDMALWSDTTASLKETRRMIEGFLGDQLKLDVKPEPYLNRTTHGLDFLGCRIFPTHQVLNARSRRRFRHKLLAVERALAKGTLTELAAQHYAQALLAFTTTPGVKSWRFRHRNIKQ